MSQLTSSIYYHIDFQDNRDKRRKNLEFILNLKMGFVEAILNPLQGDYGDVALVPQSLIEDFNKVVLYEADTKVRI
jgi:hypothetical protein